MQEYIDRLAKNAVTLVLDGKGFMLEEAHVNDFAKYEKIGILKYFKPSILQQLRNQRIQMRLAKQLIKARFS